MCVTTQTCFECTNQWTKNESTHRFITIKLTNFTFDALCVLLFHHQGGPIRSGFLNVRHRFNRLLICNYKWCGETVSLPLNFSFIENSSNIFIIFNCEICCEVRRKRGLETEFRRLGFHYFDVVHFVCLSQCSHSLGQWNIQRNRKQRSENGA